MHRLLVTLASVLLAAASASAQTTSAPATNPESEFAPWSPSDAEAPPPAATPPATSPAPLETTPPPVTPPPPVAPSRPSSSAASSEVSAAPEVRKPPEFNHVSIYGGETLGQGNRGLGLYLGFPLVGLKAGIGVLDRLDVGLGFDSFYGVMNEPRAFVKFLAAKDSNWALSLQVEGGMAFFLQKPELDASGHGARWLTGRRNYNLEPGLIVSYRGDSPQAARLFMDLRYQMSFDTEPFTKDPLGGVPGPVLLGSNFPVRLGAEMPFSPSTAFLFQFGFDIHTRKEDAAFMPVVSVGLVTGI